MNAIHDSLGAHHKAMEGLVEETVRAARASDWAGYRRRFAELRLTLVEHMAYEEEELFPALARSLGSEAPLAPLREQHEQLRQHFETLGAAAPEHDPEGCLAEIDALEALLRTHHASEQGVCYPQSDRLGLVPPPPLAAAPRALDLRGLQPPEPMVRIFQALERSPREPLRAILPHEPVPLYGLLRERGFSYRGTARADGGFEVLIEPV